VAISVHRFNEFDYGPLFRDADAIFRNHLGRPHWGKVHYHTATDLRQLYPAWDDFLTVREQLDPAGRFLNRHLRDIFGL